MIPLQLPGGVEILILLLIYAVVGLVPVVAALAALYFLYKIRKDTKSMSRSLERIADTQSARGTGPGSETVGGDTVEGGTVGNAEE